jgi:hypothetical protein
MAAVIVAILLAGAAIAGLVIGARRRGATGAAPPWLEAAVLVIGALALFALALPLLLSWAPATGDAEPWLRWVLPASIAFGLVAVATGGYAVIAGRRSWRTWVGLACGAVVTAFWIVFAVGELLYPH